MNRLMKYVAEVAPRPLPCRLSLSELLIRLADWTPTKHPTSVRTAAILKRYLHPVLGHSARTRYCRLYGATDPHEIHLVPPD